MRTELIHLPIHDRTAGFYPVGFCKEIRFVSGQNTVGQQQTSAQMYIGLGLIEFPTVMTGHKRQSRRSIEHIRMKCEAVLRWMMRSTYLIQNQ